MGFIARCLGNAFGLYVSSLLLEGLVLVGGIRELLVAGVVLALLNYIVKPILKALSFPFIILSLGLFLLVINVAILWILDRLFDFITFESLLSLIGATIIIALINFIFSAIFKRSDKEKDDE